jgi:hypothetical protein
MKARVNPVLGPLRNVAGLFFDDGSLAIVVLVVFAATAIRMNTAWFDGPVAIAFLVSGIIAALLENVVRTARASLLTD